MHLLRWRAAEQGQRQAYTFLPDEGGAETRLTYAELDVKARAIAALLAELGAAGQRVLLLYPASLEYVAAFFGCLYAGAVAVPVYPPRRSRSMPRVQSIVADCRPAVALTTGEVFAAVEKALDQLPDLGALAWRTTDDVDASLADGWRQPAVDADTLAFLQYTSGSTAAPKGVMVSHGNLLHNESLIQRACEHSEETPFVSWLPLYHDLGLIGNVLQSLYIGAPCTLMSPVSFLKRPARWLEAVTRYRAHTSGGPNFAYELCTRKIPDDELAGFDLSSWKVAFNGAEPVRAETLERFARRFARCGFDRRAFYPCYGMAETTLIVSGGGKAEPPVMERFAAAGLEQDQAEPVTGEAAGGRPLVGCGRALGELEVVIADPQSHRRLPEGRVGEIWVAGPSVCQGYWNRPEVTAETFQARLGDGGEGPFLRTGDLGFLHRQELYITGRLKDLIIVRGNNHYPQDIELTVERAHPALRPGCGAAFAVEREWEERLVVVQELDREHREPDFGDIAAQVRRAIAAEHELELAELVLIRHGTLPKTSSGKIQRRKTREDLLAGELAVVGRWSAGEAAEAGEEAPPALPETLDEVERWLLARLPAGSRLEQPVPECGLDSLKAIELAHAVESDLGVALPLDRFFEEGTVGSLAEEVHRHLGEAGVGPAAGAAPEPPALSPLSHGQRALWFLHELEPDSPAYHITTAVRLIGEVDLPALRGAFQALVDRHPALRTTFESRGGKPLQRLRRHAGVAFQADDARDQAPEPVHAELLREARRPFELERGPLFRLHLWSLSDGEHLLLLALHHIVGDLWSLAVLAQELGEAYSSVRRGRAPRLAPLPATYADYVRAQEELLASEAGERLWHFWEQELAGEPPDLDLPTDRPRPPVQTYCGATLELTLPPATSEAVRALARASGGSLFSTLLGSFQALLHRLSGQRRILVGSPAAGRVRAELAGVVGYFVNPVVIQGDFAGDPPGQAVTRAAARSARAALEHQEAPFPLLVERLQPDRDPSRSPLFQVMFAWQAAPGPAGEELAAFAVGREGARLELGELTLEHYPLEQAIAQFDLTLSLGEVAGRLTGTLDYNVDLFDEATAQRWLRSFQILLAALAAQPRRRVSELPLLAVEEESQLLLEWSSAAQQVTEERPVHALVAARAAADPAAPAVLFAGARLAYGELTRRAGRLAQRLRAAGVGPEDLVAVRLPRSLDLPVALLAVLQAGAAYLPLDPDDPPERTAFMLADAGASLLLVASSEEEPPPAAGSSAGRTDASSSEGTARNDRAGGDSVGGARPGASLLQEQDAPSNRVGADGAGGPGSGAQERSEHPTRPAIASGGKEARACLSERQRASSRAARSEAESRPVGSDPATAEEPGPAEPSGGPAADTSRNVAGPRPAGAVGGPTPDTLGSIPVLRLDDELFAGVGAAADGGAPEPPVQPESAACLIYTSGSTGEPKGVTLTHGNLSALVASFAASYQPGAGDRILPLTSLASASFTGEVLPLLAAGGAVVLPVTEQLLAPTRTFELMETSGVSILSTVPSMIAAVNALADRLPRLRLVLVGGEALAAGDVDRLVGKAELVNGYGLTETTICSTIHRLEEGDFAGTAIPIGRPLPGHRLYLLDANLRLRPPGTPGELFITGSGLARGYRGRPALTARRFLPDPYAHEPGQRIYRTGDLVRWRTGGDLEFLGRVDQQVKIRGFRIELGEVESVLSRQPEVAEAAVVVREDEPGERFLAAYVVAAADAEPLPAELAAHLKERLPDYMVPAAFVPLEVLPLTATGKVDVRALPAPERGRGAAAAAYEAPRGELERRLAAVWREALGVEEVGVQDNFFDLGGHSLLLARVHRMIEESLDRTLSLVDLFKYPTIASLATYLGGGGEEETAAARAVRRVAARPGADAGDRSLAVVGLAGRFPGAKSPDELWANLLAGKEAIRTFSDDELYASGIPRELVENPNYIKAKGILGDVDQFDAGLFGVSARAAELMDPQHRVFLECAWEALENAGWDPERYPGHVGVFAGQSMNTYWLNNLYGHIDLVASVDSLEAAIGNDKDSLTTEISYRLNLKGPSVLVQSSSSTSLTAIHYACQSLLAGECDMALAGGVSIHLPEVSGYLYHEGGTTSPDGHCRTFDSEAKGFVSGHGAGVVVLKRLADALADGDTVHAVIKGSACNNDGSVKVSYMAPSVDGHAEVVAMAQAAAGVEADSISYLEAHGTGTLLGDPIEIAALTQAFRLSTPRKGFCAIGSLKTNIGHLDTAAGAAGLIKAVLCLEHKTLPPSLHFQTPNPKIDFADSPFFVNHRLRPWEVPAGQPRRAGVSSLGMGGTNTHVVLEEAPPVEPSGPCRPWELLVFSARTPAALDALSERLAGHLESHPEGSFGDVAFTLASGRRRLARRRMVVAADPADAARVLRGDDPERLLSGYREGGSRSLAFLFSGQGTQYPGMTRGLYEGEPVFRREVDRAAELLQPVLGLDLRQLLYPESDEEAAAERLRDTAVAQPALFTVEHALARLLMEWGIQPQAMLGHSIGEYTAACLAGVFSCEDALRLVAARGRLMAACPTGSMVAVPLAEKETRELLAGIEEGEELSLAAVNRPATCVVSGPEGAVEALIARLADQGHDGRRLHTSHAFHSAMMEPALEPFGRELAGVELAPPRIPFLSNSSGTWIRPEEATDPEYWVRHLRDTVRFADGVAELLAEPDRVLVEVGPGNTLATAASQHPARIPGQEVVATVRHPRQKAEDLPFLLTAAGRLWLAGVELDWNGYFAGQRRRRIPLPTYPFERQRYWVEPKALEVGRGGRPRESANLADWFFAPVWKRSLPPPANGDPARAEGGGSWLLFLDDVGLGEALARRLADAGQRVVTARPGPELASLEGYRDLLAGLDEPPRRILHLWSLTARPPELEEALDRGFRSLLLLGRALGEKGEVAEGTRLLVISNGLQEVTGEEELAPEKAPLLGPCRVLPQEIPGLACRSVDLAGPVAEPAALAERLLEELAQEGPEPVVALRGAHRWVESFEPATLPADAALPLRQEGVYLLTGGLGGLGLAVAEHLARTVRARLVLVGRTPLPERGDWQGWLAQAAEDDPVRRKIEAVRRLEELGAEVLAASADVADPASLARVKAAAVERFGAVHGVIHAAGVPGGGLIQVRDPAAAEAVLAPKVRGTRALDELFSGEPLDCFVLFSSVTSVLAPLGQADYAAANAFLDAFARARSARGERTLAINWDAWREVGMAVTTEVPDELKAFREESLRQGLSPREGVEAFDRILRSRLPQVVVSRRDFAGRLEELWASRGMEQLPEPGKPGTGHPRPELPTPFVAPQNDAERRLAVIWQELLGIDEVGVHDNFFDLGGNSLIGLKVVARVREEMGAELSAVTLFEGPTVRALAELLEPEGKRGEAVDQSKSRGERRRARLLRKRQAET